MLISSGAPFHDEILDSMPDRAYGITSLPVTYDQPISSPSDIFTITIPATSPNLSACIQQSEPPRKLVNLSKLPILVVTSQASFHAPYDYCTVNYLRQAGVSVKWLNLAGIGIHGNAHFIFLEKNSLEIVPILEAWINTLDGSYNASMSCL